MAGNPDRKLQPRQRSVLRRAWAATIYRVEYWKRSHLVRRLQAADVINQGLLVAAVLLLCFVPFLLVLQSVSGRKDASGFVRRFGLTGEAAHAVRQALTSPTPPSAAVSGLTWAFFILFGIAAAGAIQELYERVFDVKGRRFWDTPRRVAWLASALGVSFVGAWTQPWLNRVGGLGLVAIAALPSATAFWWFSMWLLLAGKLSWRELFPSAVATGLCWVGMVIFMRLTLPSAIASNYRKYGSAGVVFAIMTLLIAIGVVITLGAVLGVAWRERHEHPPGAQPGSRPERDGLHPADARLGRLGCLVGSLGWDDPHRDRGEFAMGSISERESREIEAANASGATPVVFIQLPGGTDDGDRRASDPAERRRLEAGR